jgi:signal transduction histidine kinase
VVVHASGTLDELELREAVVDAVRLAAANVRLRAEVEAQVGELTASRRRLVVAGDAEGERLAQRLRDGAMRRLETVGSHLDDAAVGVAGSGAMATAVERARERLHRVTDDLHRFALGLDPRPLSEGGLAAALGELARDCPVPVTLDMAIDLAEPSGEVATAMYLVCAEALANATRHAQASSISIALTAAPGSVRLTVVDDGVGGAALGAGHGLRNRADRVTSLGGTFTLRSPEGHGTRVEVSLPLPVETHSSKVEIPMVNTDAAPTGGA